MPLSLCSKLILPGAGLALALVSQAAAQTAPPRTTGDADKPGGFVTVPTTSALAPLKPADPAPVAAVPPRLLTAIVGPDDYPAALIEAGAQGRVVVSITISASGMPTACSLVRSSGFSALDNHSCALAMAHARFDPARNEQGEAVRSVVHAPISWQIPAE